MESSSGSEWEDVDEEEDATRVTCLFCVEDTSCPEALFKHCLEKHEIDIIKMIREHGRLTWCIIIIIHLVRMRVVLTIVAKYLACYI